MSVHPNAKRRGALSVWLRSRRNPQAQIADVTGPALVVQHRPYHFQP